MLRIFIAILVAAVAAAIVAGATEPVAAVGASVPQPAAKADRLDARQRANCSRPQAEVSSSSRQCQQREEVIPTTPHVDVRIAWIDVRLMNHVAD